MARIQYTNYREGETPNAPELIARINILAPVDLDQKKTKLTWVTRNHLVVTAEIGEPHS